MNSFTFARRACARFSRQAVLYSTRTVAGTDTSPSPSLSRSLKDGVQEHFRRLYSPSFGKVSSAADLSANRQSSLIAFTGHIRQSLDGGSVSRICTADYVTGDCAVVTRGPGSDRLPQWSPDGRRLAFLSDRQEPNVFQVYLFDPADNTCLPIPTVPGNVESISWSASPSDERLLIRVVDQGAEQKSLPERQEWTPSVQSSEKPEAWRKACSYDLKTGRLERVGTTRTAINFWEVCWLGPNHVLAVTSQDPSENGWYRTCLSRVHLSTGAHNLIYQRPNRQLGCPAASPSGSHIAVIECLGSDRGGVAGDVLLLNTSDMKPRRLDLKGVDVTQIIWHTETLLSYIGLRNTSTVAGHFCLTTGAVQEVWNSPLTSGAIYPEATVTADGSCALVSEGWNEYQKLILVKNGSQIRTVQTFEHEGSEWLRSVMGNMQSVSWQSTDGVEVQGYLCLPLEQSQPPQRPPPLILNVHGGPVYTFRNKWQLNYPIIPLLASQGYAVLSANPRGSTGRGQDFCEKVLGDLGGGDAQDLLSGIDAMIARGFADPARIGIMGVSYGGYMATWLPTQSDRFAASVAIAPVTNWCSNHGTSNIGYFDELFFGTNPYKTTGLYQNRSSVMFAGKYSTPVLQITGAKDRCVHPSQALEYHRASLEAGVQSTLVTYPNEGHGIRHDQPAYTDFSIRVCEWFHGHLCV
ncbi:MAG: hypothetical protein M1818_004791 [Claussenomyces sp. TS43310]|nr:MAG: hypothetical protein M1818_004791 [Claussenomyces sp. TS43310]